MADYQNFTPDEQLILSLILAKDALLTQITKLTGNSYQDLDLSLSTATGIYSARISDENARQLIEHYRIAHRDGFAMAMEELNADNN